MLSKRCCRWLIRGQVVGFIAILPAHVPWYIKLFCAVLTAGVILVWAFPGREPNPLTNTSRASP